MAQSKVQTLLADKRYAEFVERYSFDCTRFAVEVCGLMPTHQQEELFVSVSPAGSRTSVASGHGCFAKGTEIMRASGAIVPVESVAVGDRLMGPDGASTRTVLELKRGREAMYRFTYMDGTSHVFNESHILCLVATNSKGTRKAGAKTTVTVREWLTWGEDKKRCHAIYRSGVETFERERAALPVPPYILGVWLGDGTGSKPEITSGDDEVSDEFTAYAGSLKCAVRKTRNSEGSHIFAIGRTKGTEQANPFTKALREIGVFENKHIPDAYLYASRQDRLELLAGLIDTDGSLDGCGYDFVQKNRRMAHQVAWLARSVGCHATIAEVTKRCVNNGASGQYWRVTIGRNIGQIPVRIPRKKRPDLNDQRTNLHFGIRSAEYLWDGDYYGFVLDGDSRFLGGDFTVLHNTGKTSGFAIIALWHLLCFHNSNTFLTGPKFETVRQGVWKEFADLSDKIQSGPQAWIRDYFEIMTERVYVKGSKLNWFIAPKSAPRGSPENMAGTHRDWLLWLADEASGIPDKNFGVIGGSMTDKRNRFCIASQPTRNTGFFRDTHHNLSKAEGGPWNALVFNSEESPLVSEEFIRDKLIEYGGRDDAEYQIKVLGQFPESTDGFLLGRKMVESRIGVPRVIRDDEPFGHLLLIDVGAGEYRDKSVATLARVIGHEDFGEEARRCDVLDIPIFTNSRNIEDFTGEIFNLATTISNCTVLVDAGGMGIAVCQKLETLGLPNVQRVKWGEPCFKTRYKDRFFNQRAQASVLASKAVKEGRISLPDRYRKDMLDQASRLPYHFDEKARYVVEKKEKMREDGIPSPDLWDTVCFAFLEGATYMQAEAVYSAGTEGRKEAARGRAMAELDGLV